MDLSRIISIFLLIHITAANAEVHLPAERHLSNIRQLTFGGQNAEGYFR